MAYTTPTVRQVDENRAVVEFSGSGVKTVTRELPVGVDPPAWAFGVLAELNAKDTVATGKPLAPGQVITPAARVATAYETWLNDFSRLDRLRRFEAAGIANAKTDADNLATTLNGTYGSAVPKS